MSDTVAPHASDASGVEAPQDVSPPEASESAGANASPPAPPAPSKRKFKLKVDQEDREVELDDAGIVSHLQKSFASQKKFEEAAQTRKHAADLLRALKENPEAVLAAPEIGVDIVARVKQKLLQEWQDSQMPEEERAKTELQRRAEAAETKLKEFEEARAAQAQEAYEQQVAQRTRETLGEALKLTGLPQTNDTLYEVAQVYRAALAKGVRLTSEQLAQETVRRLDSYTNRYVGELSGEQLYTRLGEPVVKKLVQYLREKHRAQPMQPPQAPPAPADSEGRPKKSDRWDSDKKNDYMADLFGPG